MATAPDLDRPAGPRPPIPPDFSAYPAPAPPAAADVATELEEFMRYLDHVLASGAGNVSVDAVVAEFRGHQNLIRRMREALRPYEERRARGEDTSIPWDLEAFKADLDRRIAAKGTPLDGPG